MHLSYYKELEKKILYMPLGSVMAIADFTNLASAKTVSKMLSRLAEEGVVEKIMCSIFWKPDPVLDAPRPEEIAKALARENNWELAPSGDTALHLLGVVDKIPDVWTFVTSGTYRKYEFKNIKIAFSHTSDIQSLSISSQAKLLVQSIKAYGKEKINREILQNLYKKCKNLDVKKLLEETKNQAMWVVKAIGLMLENPMKE